MHNLYFPAMQDVGARIARAPHLLLALDYDGTLTSIVDDPADAHLAPPMRQVLAALARRDEVALAIFSGRDDADLQALVGMPGVIYASNHGLEIHGPDFHFVEMEAAAASQAVHALAQRMADTFHSIQGVRVDDKGLSLSVHYRHVLPVDREAVCHAVRAAVELEGDRFGVTHGDMAYEIRPHQGWNKGDAVQWIRRQLGETETFILYMGNDATDEHAFAALAKDANLVTIKIGDSAETAAHYVLPGPAEAQSFLEWISEILRERTIETAAR